jgi:hypothetical protein
MIFHVGPSNDAAPSGATVLSLGTIDVRVSFISRYHVLLRFKALEELP